jgi:chromosome partitioning protein
MKRVIAVLNQKGGVGKTTTVINLAAYLAKSGHKVLIIDLDPQGNTTSGLGIDKLSLTKNTYQALLQNATPSDVIISSSVAKLDLIPTNADLAGAEVQLVKVADRESNLRHFIATIDDTYEYVFIDCPPSLGLLSINALVASTDVIIPVQTEYYAMEGLSQLIQVIDRVQAKLNPTLQILGVAMTMYDSRTTLGSQVHEEIKRVFGELVFDTLIPRNVRLAEAPSHGKPIVYYDKWSKGARAYKNLAKEVQNRARG